MKKEMQQLREALLDLTGVLNRPQPDSALLELAGVNLDRALFPLLMRIENRGPLGIVELAELCGRDYTTISRQVTKLEALGLVVRRANQYDARIKEVMILEKGLVMTKAIDKAREKLISSLFVEWDKQEVTELVRLLRKFADEALKFVQTQANRAP